MNAHKTALDSAAMKEALRLVQAGQLNEATAVLQGSLTGGTPSSSSSPTTTTTQVIPQIYPSLNVDLVKPAKRGMNTLNDLMGKMGNLANLKLDLPATLTPANTGSFHPSKSDPVPENAQYINKLFSHAQGKRHYRLYIPASYQQDVDKGLTLPLLIMLHGCTQSPEDFAVGTRMNHLAETQHCLIAYPDQPVSANQNRCWNWFRPTDQHTGQGEPLLLAGITRSIIQDYAIDPQRVYIAGLSAGGAMTVIMAETYPELYAAAGIHSGLAYRSASDLPSALMTMNGRARASQSPNLPTARFVPTIMFHGDQDRTVATQNGEQIFEQAKHRLKTQTPTFQTRQHQQRSTHGRLSTQTCLSDADGKVQLEYWLLHGAGHAWAGGNSDGSYTDPTGPDASVEMLRFFLSHARD